MNARPIRALRVYHGPVNLGGAAGATAQWQREHGYDSDCIVYHGHKLFDNAHMDLKVHNFRLRAQVPLKLFFFFYCLVRYNVFHFWYGKSLLPLNIDLPVLRLVGRKIVMNYCGSDIRIMSLEAKRNSYVDLLENEMDNRKRDWKKKIKLRWQRLWVHRAIAVRNLALHAGYAYPREKIVSDIWVNNSVEIPYFEPLSDLKRDVPTVVHAPSHAGIKGTTHIEDAVNRLKAEGYLFNFILLQDVSNPEAQRIYREEADIIIDQIIAGGFGNLAVEGMLAGKPVIGSLLDDIKEEYCPDCPIVVATIRTIKEKLAWLLDSPEARTRLGQKGREFVNRYCDRDRVGRQLWKLYESL